MAHSKKNSSWLMPSFDNEPVRKSPKVNRTVSHSFETSAFNAPSTRELLPRRRSTSDLSALLEACEPRNSSELVVSRQKQQEISNWLQHEVRRGRPCALILSGSSGCGKTTAIRVLAKENGFNVTEWINPIDPAMDENNRVMRQGDRFEEFLIRATRYKSVLSNYSSRILLIKDFPNVYMDEKDNFYSLLGKYFEMGKEPIVFICTDSGNSKLLQMLFPPHIREKFGIELINVNPVTQAAMKNALKRISNTLNSIAGHMLNVTQEKIDEILSNSVGDIRNAVLNIIFISLRVPEEQKENTCNTREESLGLLHGVGRVINPKRVQNGNSWKFAHDPDEIAAFFQSQATVFLRFLQENYLTTMRGIEEVDVCGDILSLADVLNAEWRVWHCFCYIQLQDPNLNKVTLSFCARGVMVANEKPVSGWNPVRKPQSDCINVQRCLAAAEVRWYESIINSKPKETEDLFDVDIESFIE